MKKALQTEHIFRHEYGPLVASLVRRVGTQHLNSVEDAVQHAMMQALNFWSRDKLPDHPAAWLYQVAYRQLLSEFRIAKRRNNLLAEHALIANDELTEAIEIPLPGEMSDALLRMLFVTCHEELPLESQLVFTLKSLCGFSVKEIALRIFLSEANVYKRFNRAKQFLKKHPSALNTLNETQITIRLPMVHRILYLLFTEGYFSSHAAMAIRQDLCEEALRLSLLLSDSKLGSSPTGYALMALMHFHMARMNARQDDSGALLLLEQQDRSLWDQACIKKGMGYLQKSAQGDAISRYHIEASIAAEHCLAPSFKETNWEKIVTSYQLLEHIAPSILHRLNHAIAISQWQDSEAGLAVLESIDIPPWLARSYYWHAVQADLQHGCGKLALAYENAQLAIAAAPNKDIKHLLHKRLAKCILSHEQN